MKAQNRVVSGLILTSLALTAQVREREVIPLKHWAAPLYWQPSQKEAEAFAAKPEAVVPATVDPPTAPLVFVGITPCRVVDTRPSQGFSGAFGPPSLGANTSRTFPLQSSTTCSIPSTALAYSFNVTVVPPGIVGFITMYPTGQPLPLAATLTDVVPGNILSNSAIVSGGTNGSIDVYALNQTDLVIDINGYYAPSSFGSTYKVEAFQNLFSGETVTLNAMCNSGDVVIGGYTRTQGTTGFSGDQRFAQIAPIGPAPAPQGWTATATGNSPAPDFLDVFAVCLHTM